MEYKVKSRIWVEVDNNVLIGEGRINLLKAIQNSGSLSKAAKALKMSYKKAWTMVDAINKTGKEPIIETSIGGSGGGGTVITPYGKKLINIFEEVNKDCWKYLDKQQKKFNELK